MIIRVGPSMSFVVPSRLMITTVERQTAWLYRRYPQVPKCQPKSRNRIHALVVPGRLFSSPRGCNSFHSFVHSTNASSVFRFGPGVKVNATSQHKVLPTFSSFLSLLTLRSALYAVLYQHWATVSAIIESCMKSMISHRTWNDPTPGLPENLQGKLTGVVVFKTVSELVIQYAEARSSQMIAAEISSRIFNRFKRALEEYPQLNSLVEHLNGWLDAWAIGIQSQPPTFQDPVTSDRETCRLTVRTLRETIERLLTIIGREHHATESRRIVRKKVVLSEAERTQALLTRLEQAYDPPGHLRPEGQRHDNDFANIVQIRICPTSEELMCPVPPHLPVTVPGAPHHLPEGSMERHLDVQFRLLREDLT